MRLAYEVMVKQRKKSPQMAEPDHSVVSPHIKPKWHGCGPLELKCYIAIVAVALILMIREAVDFSKGLNIIDKLKDN